MTTAGPLTIATWNVNSIRARIERLLAWLPRASPDIVCLQELKVEDSEFPEEEIRAAGYQAVYHGQRTYNGVAILSRTPLSDVRRGIDDGSEAEQTRLIAATVQGIRVISAYFPNGQSVGTDKWAYKLDWMGRLKAHLQTTYRPSDPIVLCGDFNVAPEDRDVAQPGQWRRTVLCHENARQRMREIVSWGLRDAIRLHHEGPGPYSWWDYRMLAFPKNNGLRIDHILLTEQLASRCPRSWIDRNERKGKLPSDHAPVLIELAP